MTTSNPIFLPDGGRVTVIMVVGTIGHHPVRFIVLQAHQWPLKTRNLEQKKTELIRLNSIEYTLCIHAL